MQLNPRLPCSENLPVACLRCSILALSDRYLTTEFLYCLLVIIPQWLLEETATRCIFRSWWNRYMPASLVRDTIPAFKRVGEHIDFAEPHSISLSLVAPGKSKAWSDVIHGGSPFLWHMGGPLLPIRQDQSLKWKIKKTLLRFFKKKLMKKCKKEKEKEHHIVWCFMEDCSNQ